MRFQNVMSTRYQADKIIKSSSSRRCRWEIRGQNSLAEESMYMVLTGIWRSNKVSHWHSFAYFFFYHTLPTNSMEYLENTMATCYLTFLFAGNGLEPTSNKNNCDIHATLTYCVMDGKGNLQCPKLNVRNRMCRNVYFFNTSPNTSPPPPPPPPPPQLSGYHNNIVDLWGFSMCSTIHYWHHAKPSTSRRNLSNKTKWQHGVTQGPISYNLPSYRKSASWKQEKHWPKL